MVVIIQRMLNCSYSIIHPLVDCSAPQSVVRTHFVWFLWALKFATSNGSLRFEALISLSNDWMLLHFGSTWHRTMWMRNSLLHCDPTKNHTINNRYTNKWNKNKINSNLTDTFFGRDNHKTKPHSICVKWYSCRWKCSLIECANIRVFGWIFHQIPMQSLKTVDRMTVKCVRIVETTHELSTISYTMLRSLSLQHATIQWRLSNTKSKFLQKCFLHAKKKINSTRTRTGFFLFHLERIFVDTLTVFSGWKIFIENPENHGASPST